MSSLAAHLIDSLHRRHPSVQGDNQEGLVQCSNGATYSTLSHGVPMNYSANPNTSFNPNMSFGGGGFGQGSFWTGSQDISEATAQQIATLQAKLDKRLGPEYISTRSGAGGASLLEWCSPRA